MNIKGIFDSRIEELAKAIDVFPWEEKNLYCQWMNQQFYLVQNSSRYLALAASLVKVEDSKEFHWWIHHLKEELDHDKTLLRDLRELGRDKLDPIFPEIRAIVGAQYYDLQKYGPDALLGYALMLEGLSVRCCSRVADRVEKAHGGKATYLRLHANVDQDHYAEGTARIANISPERQQIVIQNLEMMFALYLNFLKGFLDKKRTSYPKAA